MTHRGLISSQMSYRAQMCHPGFFSSYDLKQSSRAIRKKIPGSGREIWRVKEKYSYNKNQGVEVIAAEGTGAGC